MFDVILWIWALPESEIRVVRANRAAKRVGFIKTWFSSRIMDSRS